MYEYIHALYVLYLFLMLVVSFHGQGDIVKKPDINMFGSVIFGGVIVFFMSLYHCVSSPSSRLEKGTARLVRSNRLLYLSGLSEPLMCLYVCMCYRKR
jgi:hypothetical protein